MDFKNLKKLSKNFDKLTQEVDKINNNKTFEKDPRFWEPTVDKAGNGYAVIRFLPAPAADGDDALPWVRKFDHAFQGPGGWYIENSLTTINQKDPVSELNNVLWNSGIDANKDIARKQKRKLNYTSNIFVVSDPAKPECNGKHFLYKYGKKIFDKHTEAMNPPFPDKEPTNPFDFWTGLNFKLKIRMVEGYRNYDLSSYEETPSVCGGLSDSELEDLWKREYSLLEFINPKNFKNYAELKARLDLVLTQSETPVTKSAEKADPTKSPEQAFKQVEKPSLNIKSTAKKVVIPAGDSDADDDYFSKLASDD